MQESTFWDIMANKKKSFTGRIAKYKRDEHIRILKKWFSLKNRRILKTDLYEEALGEDYVIDFLFKNSNNTFAIDISKNIVNKAKSNFKGKIKSKNFKVADVRKIPFKNSFFDIIFSDSTLDHFPKKELIKSLLEIKGVLKKDGEIFLSLNNKNNFLLYYLTIIGMTLKLTPFYFEFYTINDIEDILNKLNFKIIDKDFIFNVPPLYNRLVNKLEALDCKFINKILDVSIIFFKFLNKYGIKKFISWYVVVKAVNK